MPEIDAATRERLKALEAKALDDPWFAAHAKSCVPGECWEWAGGKMRNGYGRTSYLGDDETVHRIAIRRLGIEIPVGMFACHHCDNRACINPSHVFVGTPKDNARDMLRKGRHCKVRNEKQRTTARGLLRGYMESVSTKRKPWARLTEEQVVAIIGSTEPQRKVADKYGISQTMVGQIKRGQCWKHLHARAAIERKP